MTDELAMALKNIPSPMRVHLREGRFAAARQAMRAALDQSDLSQDTQDITWREFQWVLRTVYKEPTP